MFDNGVFNLGRAYRRDRLAVPFREAEQSGYAAKQHVSVLMTVRFAVENGGRVVEMERFCEVENGTWTWRAGAERNTTS